MDRPARGGSEDPIDLASLTKKRPEDSSRRRRDSADRISFGQLAILAVSKAPPPMPGASAPAEVRVPRPLRLPSARPARDAAFRRRPRGTPWPVRILAGVGAITLGVALSAALGVENPASAESGAAVPDAPPALPAAPALADPGPEPEASPAAIVEASETEAPDPAPVLDEAARDRERRRAERRAERREQTARSPEVPEAAPAIAPEPAAPAPTDLPETPSRDDVAAALTAVQPAVVACAAGEGGSVQVRVTVGSSGRVRTALVSGDFVGTPVGSCIARAVRTARTPPFAAESFSVTYPYALPYAR